MTGYTNFSPNEMLHMGFNSSTTCLLFGIETMILKICLNCSKNFSIKRKQLFCSRICYIEYKSKNSINIEMNCNFCNKIFYKKPSSLKNSKSGFYFCCRNCKDSAQRLNGIKAIQPKHYGSGSSSYRIRALNEFNPICNRCGYSEDDRMLDVHHLDNNRLNNDLSNLEVLCVWCHAQETRKNWKSIKSGRKM